MPSNFALQSATSTDCLASATELIEQKVDIIVTVGHASGVAARKATSAIPIVAIPVTDPVGRGLVEEPRETWRERDWPCFWVGLDSFSKGLEFLKEAVPSLQTVAVASRTRPILSMKLRQAKWEAAALALNLRRKVSYRSRRRRRDRNSL